MGAGGGWARRAMGIKEGPVVMGTGCYMHVMNHSVLNLRQNLTYMLSN